MILLLGEWLRIWTPWFVGLTAFYILADIVYSAFRRGR